MIIALAATGCSAASEAASPITPADASSFGQLGGVGGLNAWQPPLLGLPQDPFAGTPADAWGDGTAGIVPPQPRSMGHFSAGQVQSAYETTGNLLAAAYLDRQTLLGGQPTAFADLLSGQQRTWFLGNLNKKGMMFGNWAGSPWVSVVGSGVAGAKCGTSDGYVHPNYPGSAKAAPSLSASEAAKQVNPYVLGAHAKGTASCQATTGT